MKKIVDFNAKKEFRDKKAVEEKSSRVGVFYDPTIDPAFVFDIIRDEQTRITFVNTLLALQQMSTDADVAITIDEGGILFQSANSVHTIDDGIGYNTNVDFNKQAYLFTHDDDEDQFPVEDIAESLKGAFESLIMYADEYAEDDDDDDDE